MKSYFIEQTKLVLWSDSWKRLEIKKIKRQGFGDISRLCWIHRFCAWLTCWPEKMKYSLIPDIPAFWTDITSAKNPLEPVVQSSPLTKLFAKTNFRYTIYRAHPISVELDFNGNHSSVPHLRQAIHVPLCRFAGQIRTKSSENCGEALPRFLAAP